MKCNNEHEAMLMVNALIDFTFACGDGNLADEFAERITDRTEYSEEELGAANKETNIRNVWGD